MADAATPYPLQWPGGHQRRRPQDRKAAKFNAKQTRAGTSWLSAAPLSIAQAIHRLQEELDRIGARFAVISSNLEIRLDGLPRPGEREPDDPGVAVYFQLTGKPHCLPCDTYTRIADNIAAVAAHIAATRAIERHGVASIAEMFAGFIALPAPASWRSIIGDKSSLAEVEEAYRRLAKERHPDAGGSEALMSELNQAREAARREFLAAPASGDN